MELGSSWSLSCVHGGIQLNLGKVGSLDGKDLQELIAPSQVTSKWHTQTLTRYSFVGSDAVCSTLGSQIFSPGPNQH
jgi:hypothetical protein